MLCYLPIYWCDWFTFILQHSCIRTYVKEKNTNTNTTTRVFQKLALRRKGLTPTWWKCCHPLKLQLDLEMTTCSSPWNDVNPPSFRYDLSLDDILPRRSFPKFQCPISMSSDTLSRCVLPYDKIWVPQDPIDRQVWSTQGHVSRDSDIHRIQSIFRHDRHTNKCPGIQIHIAYDKKQKSKRKHDILGNDYIR